MPQIKYSGEENFPLICVLGNSPDRVPREEAEADYENRYGGFEEEKVVNRGR